MQNKTIIVIPTYNESKSIEKIIQDINNENVNVDILVVDDDSPDGTSDIVASIQDVYSNVFLITKKEDKGFARAYISGFKFALDNGYSKIIQMDADGSHQPKYLKKLLEASQTSDYVIGSRWVKGGSVKNWPLKRLIISKVGNFYSRIMLRSSIKDITGGFKVINSNLLLKMKTQEMTSRGYSFQIELYLKARENKANIKEVPIEFIEREEGVSKMSKSIVKEAIMFVTKKGLKRA